VRGIQVERAEYLTSIILPRVCYEEYKNRKLEPMEQENANEHMKIFEDIKTKKTA
jgi:hypothetical protein